MDRVGIRDRQERLISYGGSLSLEPPLLPNMNFRAGEIPRLSEE